MVIKVKEKMSDLYLAEHCRKSYEGCVEHEIECDCKIILDHIRAYYYSYEKLLVIVGSDDCEDWKANLNCRPIAGEHAGYHQESILLYHKLVKEEIYPRVITGHSMGGAIGSLLIKYLASVEEVVTFGCPNYYYNYWNGDVARHYVIPSDVITYLPFEYYKCGKVIKLPVFDLNPFRSHSMKTYIKGLKKYEKELRDSVK